MKDSNYHLYIKIIIILTFLFSCDKMSSSENAGETTFEGIKNHALFMNLDHKKYTAFAENEFKVIKVTNLDKSGPGSFGWAINESGPRIVVFEVGGVIDLEQSSLTVRQPYLFVAGQTAPPPGITIIKGGIGISSHDVIIQHISVRPGDCNLPAQSGWERDGLATYNGYNVVIDHCSFTWATDENLSASGPQYDGAEKTSHAITFSNCIIAEALYESTHTKGIHSMGTLIFDYCRNIAIVGNLYAQNDQRNPLLKPNSVAYIVNNLIYNPKSGAIHASWPVEEYVAQPDSMRSAKATIIGNVLIPGADSQSMYLINGSFAAYQEDNINVGSTNIISSRVTPLGERPVWTGQYTVISSGVVTASVLKNAGSRPAERNSVDQRIVDDVKNKKGKVINSQNEVGGYPAKTITRRELQIPDKGIENWLESLSDELTK